MLMVESCYWLRKGINSMIMTIDFKASGLESDSYPIQAVIFIPAWTT